MTVKTATELGAVLAILLTCAALAHCAAQRAAAPAERLSYLR